MAFIIDWLIKDRVIYRWLSHSGMDSVISEKKRQSFMRLQSRQGTAESFRKGIGNRNLVVTESMIDMSVKVRCISQASRKIKIKNENVIIF